MLLYCLLVCCGIPFRCCLLILCFVVNFGLCCLCGTCICGVMISLDLIGLVRCLVWLFVCDLDNWFVSELLFGWIVCGYLMFLCVCSLLNGLLGYWFGWFGLVYLCCLVYLWFVSCLFVCLVYWLWCCLFGVCWLFAGLFWVLCDVIGCCLSAGCLI